MPPIIKITPNIDYTFALNLTRSNMQPYYDRYAITWEDPCFATNWQQSENFGLYQADTCIGVIRLQQDQATSYLADLQLIPSVQGQGIGSYALGYMQQLAKIRQKHLMSLVAFVDNPAIKLYTRYGFKSVSTTEVLTRMECVLS